MSEEPPERDDVEDLVARRQAEPRRGTPAGREPVPGRARTRRLIVVTAALVLASAAVLVVVAVVAG